MFVLQGSDPAVPESATTSSLKRRLWIILLLLFSLFFLCQLVSLGSIRTGAAPLQTMPISIRASAQADYSADTQVAGVRRVGRNIFIDIIHDIPALTPADRLATVEAILETPVPTMTGVPERNTSTPTSLIEYPTLTSIPPYTSTPTFTRTRTSTATLTPTLTRTLSGSETATFTPTRTNSPTRTFTPTHTHTNTSTFTRTSTATPTSTASPTRTHTPTYTFTATFTHTSTYTPTGTYTPTRTFTPTATSTPTSTHTFTSTASPTRTFTPTYTHTSTSTHTFTQTPSPTASPTHTFTASPTSTFTPTASPTSTFTPTSTYTPTPENTATFTPTYTRTLQWTPTSTISNGCVAYPSTGFTASLDSWVDKTRADQSNGADSKLQIRPTGGVDKRALVYFNLASIPPGSIIHSAYLYLSVEKGRIYTVQFYPIIAAWDESVTWNTMPSFDASSAGSLALDNGTCTRVSNLSVSLVSAWVNDPSGNFGIYLYPIENSGDAEFSSREGAAPPILVVDYEFP